MACGSNNMICLLLSIMIGLQAKQVACLGGSSRKLTHEENEPLIYLKHNARTDRPRRAARPTDRHAALTVARVPNVIDHLKIVPVTRRHWAARKASTRLPVHPGQWPETAPSRSRDVLPQCHVPPGFGHVTGAHCLALPQSHTHHLVERLL